MDGTSVSEEAAASVFLVPDITSHKTTVLIFTTMKFTLQHVMKAQTQGGIEV
jgi:hypothetical protein